MGWKDKGGWKGAPKSAAPAPPDWTKLAFDAPGRVASGTPGALTLPTAGGFTLGGPDTTGNGNLQNADLPNSTVWSYPLIGVPDSGPVGVELLVHRLDATPAQDGAQVYFALADAADEDDWADFWGVGEWLKSTDVDRVTSHEVNHYGIYGGWAITGAATRRRWVHSRLTFDSSRTKLVYGSNHWSREDGTYDRTGNVRSAQSSHGVPTHLAVIGAVGLPSGSAALAARAFDVWYRSYTLEPK